MNRRERRAESSMINYRSISAILGMVIFFVAAMMCLPLVVSVIYRDGDTPGLLISVAATAVAGALLLYLGKGERNINLRDGFAVVTFGWLGMALAGALPFVLTNGIPSFTDAMFESTSGFTTTGASILGGGKSIEALPRGLLFWRSLTHWIGGMGIILLSLAVLPLLKVGGMQLFKAEFPGPVKDKLTPRIQDTAEILWGVYAAVSAVEFLLLLAGGMTAFDAACHTFGTMATGGFSTHSNSIAYFDNRFIHYVIIFFMIAAGTNFTLHYHLFRGRLRGYWHSHEFRLYLSLLGGFTLILTLGNLLRGAFTSVEETVRQSLFHCVSIMTTTGYGAADWEAWGDTAQVLMVLMMMIGGMAGSTGGGVKVIRVQVMMRQVWIELKRLIHPQALLPLRIGSEVIEEGIVRNVLVFLLAFGLLLVFSTALLTLTGLDLVTSFGASIACLSNIGPGLGTVGPIDNYGHLLSLAKWILIILMILGRLEVFTVLVLFSRHFWRK